MEEVINKIGEKLKENFDANQDRPNQYIVGYYRVSDNELIGYHLSSFCEFSNDILAAKRYSGENPYKQLEVISKNLKSVIDVEHIEGELFTKVFNIIKANFNSLSITKSSELYLDAIYLAEGTPKQSFKFEIIS